MRIRRMLTWFARKQMRDNWSVEEQDIGRRFYYMLICLILCFISLFSSYRDLQFMFQSKEATAEFIKFSDIRGRHGQSYSKKHFLFSFIDFEGKKQRGYDEVPYDWQQEDVKGLRIKYLPGVIQVDDVNTVCRLASQSNGKGFIFLLFSTGALVISGWFFWQSMDPSKAK